MNKTIKTLAMAALAAFTFGFAPSAQAEYTDDCITFSSAASFTLKTFQTSKNWDGTLWTSTDKTNWTVWEGASVDAAQTGGAGDYYLYVRGDANNTKITGNDVNYRWVLDGSNISCSGNIETLRGATGEAPSTKAMAESCYYAIFQGCTALATAPALPATTLADSCYYWMFNGCTSLTAAPALPATALAVNCYANMFRDCSALTTAPALSAETLAEGCYSYMFGGCAALTTAPELPATTLAEGCYANMFYGCSSLTAAPVLPAETLAENCYEGMFYDCTKLPAAPELPVTELATNCYARMFWNCTSLTNAPALLATTLPENCYMGMFYNTALESPAMLDHVTTIGYQACSGMYAACAKLKVNNDATEAGYAKPWVVNATSVGEDWNLYMFMSTTGSFTGDPVIGTTYYIKGEGPTPTTPVATVEIGGMMTEYMTITEAWTAAQAGTAEDHATLTLLTNVTVTAALSNTAVMTLDLNGYVLQQKTDGQNVLQNTGTLTINDSRYDSPDYRHYFVRDESGNWSLVENETGDTVYGGVITGGRGSGAGVYNGGTLTLNSGNIAGNSAQGASGGGIMNSANLTVNGGRICYNASDNGAGIYNDYNGTVYLLGGRIEDNGGIGVYHAGANLILGGGLYIANNMQDGKARNLVLPASKAATISLTTPLLENASIGVLTVAEPTSGSPVAVTSNGTTDDATRFHSDGGYVVTYENGKVCLAVPPPPQGYLTFSSAGGFDLAAPNRRWNGSLQYSTDQTNWKVWDGSSISAAQGGSGYVLYVGGDTNNTTIAYSGAWTLTPAGENKIDCSGNIEALRGATGDDPSPTPMAENCYANLFSGCTALSSAPKLTATNLVWNCYNGMFSSCSSLTTAPALPATTLAPFCYGGMFQNCTALTTAPALPATNLAEYCYQAMFYNCSSLTTAPELPAKTLESSCYDYMFQNTSLTAAPALPAETLAPYCYHGMFWGCKKLKQLPAISVAELPEGCCAEMFMNCLCIVLQTEETTRGSWSVQLTGVTAAEGWNTDMLASTGGAFTGNPEPNTLYYYGTPKHSIGTTVTPEGSGTVNVPETAEEGASVTVTLTPESGEYKFGSIDAIAEGEVVELTEVTKGQEYTFTMPKANVDISVAFVSTRHSITNTVTPAGSGTVSVSETALEGADVGVELYPEEGWGFKSIDAYKTGDPETKVTLKTGTEGSYYTFTMPAYDVTVAAAFGNAPVEYLAPVYKTAGDPKSGIQEWQNLSVSDYTVVTSATSAVTWGTAGTTSWYVLKYSEEPYQIDGGVTCAGHVNLILVNGASLTITNVAANKAGIQTDPSGSFTIYGQTDSYGALTVTGGQYGAGIGGGFKAVGSNITINGGTVTAKGGENTEGNSGAGIGGGFKAVGSNITINGGTVAATGGQYSAGIGGGRETGGSDITINGGTVTAVGGGRSAGIGGGYGNTGSGITINDGTVTAVGDCGAAAIGGGLANVGFDISITNATLYLVSPALNYEDELVSADVIGSGFLSEESSSGVTIDASAKVFFNLTGVQNPAGEWLEPIAPMPEYFEGMTIMTPETQVATNRVLVGGCAEWTATATFNLTTNATEGATGTITVNNPDGTVFANKLLKLPHDTTAQTLTLTAEDPAPTKHAITLDTVTGGTIWSDKSEAAEGETVQFTATPGEGYTLESKWYFTNSSGYQEVTGDSFTMPGEDVMLTATFTPVTPADPVASVTVNGETTQYETIEGAWTAACVGTSENPALLTLLRDVTTKSALYMDSSSGTPPVMTLDLNGCALQAIQPEASTGDPTFSVIHNYNGTLTIQDSQYGQEEGMPRFFEQGGDGIWRMVDYPTDIFIVGGVITGGHIDRTSEEGSDGGAIRNEGTLVILSGVIAGNSVKGNSGESNDAGAISIAPGASFRMEGGDICYNFATDSGGGVTVCDGAAQAEIVGGTIHDNIAQMGGGVSIEAGSTLTVSNGTFYSNTATGLGGGAFGNQGTLTVAGGEIYDNTAQDASGLGEGGFGGGIGNIGTLTISGGEIHDNTGTMGAGIGNYYMGETQPGIMTMTGGEVTKNVGSGVLHAGDSLTLGGAAVITGNKNGLTPCNLVLPTGSSGQQLLTVSTDEPLTEGASIGVTTQAKPEEGLPVQISTPCNGDYTAYFSSDSDICRVEYNTEDTCLYLAKLPTYDITYAKVDHGSMTSDPAGGAYAGVRVKLIDVPENGWHLGSVVVETDNGDEIAVTNNFFTMPEANVTVTATFVEGADYVASVTIRNGAGVVETTSYTTIGEAWAAAKEGRSDNPATLTLLKDIALEGKLGILEDEPGIVMTLDLNGRVLQQTAEGARVLDIDVGDITITDSHFGEDAYTQYFEPSESGIWTLVTKVTDYPVKGGVITGGNIGEEYDGAAILCGGNLKLVAGNIAGNYNNAMNFSIDGGGVRIKGEGTLTMTGGEICYNFATISGGGLVIGATNGVSVVSGGKIHHNTAMMGGGISIDEDSRLTITGDADICDNTAYYYESEQVDLSGVGGGVAVIQGGYLAVSGGKIHNNTALGVGGGGIGSQSVVEISGGEIYENTAVMDAGEGGLGGGVASAYRLTITGGDIRDNTASMGGGGVANLGMDSSVTATVTMTGGTITGNVCEDGGGVYSWAAPEYDESGAGVVGFYPAALIITGGEVTGNTGPAVVHMGTAMTVGGTAVIEGNLATETPSLCLGVDMQTGEGLVTAVSATTPLAEGASIGVYTAVEPTQGYPVKFATNVTDGVATNYFHSDMGYEVVYVEEEQALYLAVEAVPVATVSIGGGEAVEYTDINTAWTAAQAGTEKAPAVLTLLKDVTTATTLYMDSSSGTPPVMTLDLNGCVLQQTTAGERVIFNYGGALTVKDSHFGEDAYTHYFAKDGDTWSLTDSETEYAVKGGVITGGNISNQADGGAIYNESGTLTILSGNFAGNSNIGSDGSYDGGAIINNYGQFRMEGGEVCYNFATDTGAGIVVDVGTTDAQILGGKIHDNTAQAGGGVAVNAGAALTVSGGEIYNNTATGTGGGGIGNTGTLTISGGEIYNNTAQDASGLGEGGFGGGIASIGTLTISGGAIYGNSANTGAGVASITMGSPAAMTMTGGAITNNYGVGVLNMGTSLTLGGTAVITGDPEYGMFGLFLPSGKTVTITNEPAFATGASIGVYTQDYPSPESPVLFATDAKETDAQYFHSDDGIDIFYDDGKLYLGGVPPKVYAITIDPASITGGTVTASAETALQGETVALTATPDSDQHILTLLRVVGDNTHTEVIPRSTAEKGVYTFTMPDDDVTVLAAFKEKHSIKTAVVGGVGGTLLSDLDQATQGTLVLLKVTPDFSPEHPYRLAKLCYSNETSGAEVSITNNLFYMPDASVTVYATFETPTPIFDIMTEVTPAEGGTVTADPTRATQGTTVSLSVVPAANYRLTSLTCFTTNEPPVEVKIVNNAFAMPFSGVKVTATFEKVEPTPPKGIQVGEDAWANVENNICTITGTTAMWDLVSGGDNPLAAYRATITNLVVQSGVTRVGSRFFHKFRKIKAVTLASSVTSLGTNAFLRCEAIDTIAFGAPQEAVTLEEGSIHYYLAITRDGEPYTVPTVTYAGEAAAMLGKEKLDDPEWEPVEPEPEKVFHFFKLAPMK